MGKVASEQGWAWASDPLHSVFLTDSTDYIVSKGKIVKLTLFCIIKAITNMKHSFTIIFPTVLGSLSMGEMLETGHRAWSNTELFLFLRLREWEWRLGWKRRSHCSLPGSPRFLSAVGLDKCQVKGSYETLERMLEKWELPYRENRCLWGNKISLLGKKIIRDRDVPSVKNKTCKLTNTWNRKESVYIPINQSYCQH